MVILEIKKFDGITYSCFDKKNNKIYHMIFEFYFMNAPIVGDKISLSENLLDEKYEGYCQPYAFKPAKNSEYSEKEKVDFAMLENKNGRTLLRRIYG